MKKIVLTILALVTLIASNAETAERIISLKPNITEILFAIGAQDNIVGVTTWCNQPEAAKNLPKVADYIRPNVEKIISLRPDLIIASKENSIKKSFEALDNINTQVVFLAFNTVKETLTSIEKIGELTNRISAAKELTTRIRKEIKSIEKSPRKGTWSQQGDSRTVLVIVGKRPLVAVGKDTFISELAERAGGQNILQSKTPYPHIDKEFILAKRPDIIIELSHDLRDKSCQTYGNIQCIKLNINEFRAGPTLGKQIKRLYEVISKR